MRRAVLWTVALLALAFVVQADTPPGSVQQPGEELRILYPSVLNGGQGLEAGRRILVRRSEPQTPEGLLELPERRQGPGVTVILGEPRTVTRGLPIRPCLAQEAIPGEENPCAVGEKLSRLAPCLDGKDCEALEVWKDAFGSPRTVPADPGKD